MNPYYDAAIGAAAGYLEKHGPGWVKTLGNAAGQYLYNNGGHLLGTTYKYARHLGRRAMEFYGDQRAQHQSNFQPLRNLPKRHWANIFRVAPPVRRFWIRNGRYWGNIYKRMSNRGKRFRWSHKLKKWIKIR